MANPKIQLRHDTSTNWQTQNPVLLEGEVAIETDSNKVKIGNGTDNYNTLPYITDQTKIDLNYSNADYQPVNKSGDTMTGDLRIRKSYPNFKAENTDIKRGQTPLADYYGDTFMFTDIDGNGMGSLSQTYLASGKHTTRLWQRGVNSDVYSVLDVGMDENDVPYCSFPNTTCCDGQYVNTNTTIATNVSVNGSSSLPYTLNLPSDGRLYMVWIMVGVNTGSASGNYVEARICSDIMSNATVARATTRTASSVTCGGTVCLVVSSSHRIYLGRATNYNGTVNLLMIGYRRIGTNS